MNIIGQMYARGEGSTLKQKNKRLICGRPMVYWTLKSAIDAGFVDQIFVFTEDDEIAQVAKDLDCVPIKRPKEMIFYHGGFSTAKEWNHYFQDEIRKSIQGEIDIIVGLNCNVCLLRSETWRQMYIRLMEDELAGVVFPVVEVEPHLYMENPKTGYLFPVWEDPGLERQKFPKLYRRIGVSISHNPRLQTLPYVRNLHHEVSFEESIDIHSDEDLFLAETFMQRRLPGEP